MSRLFLFFVFIFCIPFYAHSASSVCDTKYKAIDYFIDTASEDDLYKDPYFLEAINCYIENGQFEKAKTILIKLVDKNYLIGMSGLFNFYYSVHSGLISNSNNDESAYDKSVVYIDKMISLSKKMVDMLSSPAGYGAYVRRGKDFDDKFNYFEDSFVKLVSALFYKYDTYLSVPGLNKTTLSDLLIYTEICLEVELLPFWSEDKKNDFKEGCQLVNYVIERFKPLEKQRLEILKKCSQGFGDKQQACWDEYEEHTTHIAAVFVEVVSEIVTTSMAEFFNQSID